MKWIITENHISNTSTNQFNVHFILGYACTVTSKVLTARDENHKQCIIVILPDNVLWS